MRGTTAAIFVDPETVIECIGVAGGVFLTRLGHTRLVSEWREVDGALERTFELPSFTQAIAFVNRIAELAEAENHHPEITVAHRKVTLRWTTHSAGAITDRDRALAEQSDALA